MAKTEKKAAKKTVKKAAKKTAKKAVKKAAKKTAKKTVKKTAKKAASLAADVEPIIDSDERPDGDEVQPAIEEALELAAEAVAEIEEQAAPLEEETVETDAEAAAEGPDAPEPQADEGDEAPRDAERDESDEDAKDADAAEESDVEDKKPRKHKGKDGKDDKKRRNREPFGYDQEMHERYEAVKRGDLLITQLQQMSTAELHEIAKSEGVKDYIGLVKQDLVFRILKERVKREGLMFGEGVLEILPDGFGFLRSPEYNYQPSPDDIYVSPSQIRRFGLQQGHIIAGQIRPPKESEKYFALLRVEAVNFEAPDQLSRKVDFEELVPAHPERRVFLETTSEEVNMRVVNLITPVGFGQRMLIVAAPRTGKTVLLQKIANAITTNHPSAYVMILLIDERPEEVTDMVRNTTAEVVSSTFDEPAPRHLQIAEMVLGKARRLVEYGRDVVIMLDSITRLARAYNAMAPRSGKILTGGVDASAMQEPRRFFGSARSIENGGSLTVIATALVDTGSRMDQVIFEEFKGTGNSELYLDRRLVDRRIWPAIDVSRSGTRKEELLLDPTETRLVTGLRKVLADIHPVEAMDMLTKRLRKTKSNAEFLMSMNPGQM